MRQTMRRRVHSKLWPPAIGFGGALRLFLCALLILAALPHVSHHDHAAQGAVTASSHGLAADTGSPDHPSAGDCSGIFACIPSLAAVSFALVHFRRAIGAGLPLRLLIDSRFVERRFRPPQSEAAA